jgi:ATP-dependent DNA ligase
MLWHSSSPPARRPAGFIEPCLPTSIHTVPTGPQWAYEIKHDGFRFVCRRDGDDVRVFSRRGHDWTKPASAGLSFCCLRANRKAGGANPQHPN